MYKIITIITFSVFVAFFVREDAPLVKIHQGAVKGKYWKTRQGRKFFGFTGIPFAKPPVGDLRFQAPIPAGPWEGILDATRDHDICPQINIYLAGYPVVGSEDCLFLNIYTPQLSKFNKKLLPVMFYIHGGAFILGSGRHDWLGPDLLLDKDIVLVVTNYRIAALGFLSTADEWAPGNNGLKDQSMALQWVKNNIIHFGGDPDRITVFGNSAGAACAHYQMISPLSRDLINGAIVQSGSAYAPYALTTTSESIKNANKLGEHLNCSTRSSRELIKCLQSVEVYEIIRQETKFSSWDNDTTIPFRIVVEAASDGAFLIEDPLVTVRAKKIANVPLITGTVTEEGAYRAAGINRDPEFLKTHDEDFKEIVTYTFGISSDQDKVSREIRKFYFGQKKINNFTKSELTHLYTDGLFLWGADTTLRLHFKHSTQPVYQYVFAYHGSTSYTTIYGDPIHDYGVCHTDEMLYLFSHSLIFPNYKPTDSDRKMTELMTTLWTNFAKTGNPTPETNSVVLEKWHPVESEHLEYYYIKNYNDLGMSKDLYPNRTKFWRSLPVRTTIIKH